MRGPFREGGKGAYTITWTTGVAQEDVVWRGALRSCRFPIPRCLRCLRLRVAAALCDRSTAGKDCRHCIFPHGLLSSATWNSMEADGPDAHGTRLRRARHAGPRAGGPGRVLLPASLAGGAADAVHLR